MANVSPEPISNIGLSLGEDALVLGGLGLLLWHPVVACIAADRRSGHHLDDVSQALEKDSFHGLARLAQVERPFRRAGGDELKTSCRRAVSRRSGARRSPENRLLFAADASATAGRDCQRAFLVGFSDLRMAPCSFVAPRKRSRLIVEIPLADASIERESRFLSEKASCQPGARQGVRFCV